MSLSHETPYSDQIETATLGGGCFWCLEPVFEDLQGVDDVIVGYAGGMIENPTYSAVCTGATGHAEVIQVHFNPQIISYKEILEVFFSVHDPTTLNRQGADVGSQYRSIILYHSESQKKIADDLISELNQADTWRDKIVTEISPFKSFFPAEDYHQEYYKKNPFQGYCQIVISPKLAKFRKTYQSRLKTSI